MYKLKIFSRAFGHPKLLSNTRWISSFLPEEIDRIINIESKEINKKSLDNNIYNYISKMTGAIDSVDDYDHLTIQYQKHFLSKISFFLNCNKI